MKARLRAKFLLWKLVLFAFESKLIFIIKTMHEASLSWWGSMAYSVIVRPTYSKFSSACLLTSSFFLFTSRNQSCMSFSCSSSQSVSITVMVMVKYLYTAQTSACKGAIGSRYQSNPPTQTTHENERQMKFEIEIDRHIRNYVPTAHTINSFQWQSFDEYTFQTVSFHAGKAVCLLSQNLPMHSIALRSSVSSFFSNLVQSFLLFFKWLQLSANILKSVLKLLQHIYKRWSFPNPAIMKRKRFFNYLFSQKIKINK